jgi:glycerol kinase
MPDVSALGAAYMAGLKAGVYADLDFLKKMSSSKQQLQPDLTNEKVKKGYNGWIETIKNYKVT